jgi:hypothetical protein
VKKKLAEKVITVVLLLATAAAARAASYTLNGFVYNADNSKGNAATENSFCGLEAYRLGIPGEIGPQVTGPDPSCTEKIFPAGYSVGNTAFYNSDVGSSQWPTVVAAGQQIVAVVQAYSGQFPGCAWNGQSYTGARKTTVIQSDIDAGESDPPDIRLQLIPQPALQSTGVNSASLTWTGIGIDDDDLVAGYTIYRSTEPGGSGGFGEIGTAPQVKGGTVTYNDTGLSVSYTYYYCLAVNFAWGGGGGAPAYLVTDAKSALSGGVYVGPSPTITETSTYLAIASSTVSPSNTSTQTATGTETASDTVTETATYTATFTATPTATLTISNTPAPAFTATITPTPTTTPADVLLANIEKNKFIIIDNPVRDGRLKLWLYAEESGQVIIYVYDITGELVFRYGFNASTGANRVDRDFKKAPGIYVVRAVVTGNGVKLELPVRKLAIIK